MGSMHVHVDGRLAGSRYGSDCPLPFGLVVYGAPLVITSRRAWVPPTDVYETEDAVVVQLEIPGVSQDDLDISMAERSLVIAGRREDPLLSSKIAYHRMEIQYGDFETKVYLPPALGQDSIKAEYHDGFLTIRLPKARTHHITVAGAPSR